MRKNPKKNLLRLNISATNICYHIIWITKYRKPLLSIKIQNELKNILNLKYHNLDISLKAFEIMPEHVHLFIHSSPLLSISFIVNKVSASSMYTFFYHMIFFLQVINNIA